MKTLTFKQQLLIGLAIEIVCFILATTLKMGIISNVGWIIYGLLFVIHPVCPETWKWRYGDDEKRMKRDFRIAGATVILFGLLIRFGV